MSAGSELSLRDRPFWPGIRTSARATAPITPAILSGRIRTGYTSISTKVFFGVAFEPETPREDEPLALNPAQVYAGRSDRHAPGAIRMQRRIAWPRTGFY